MTAATPTRRLERVPVAPGPIPPRWVRSAHAHRYRHYTGSAGAHVHPVTGRTLVSLDLGTSSLSEAHEVVRDLADLMAWLARGGR